MADQEKTVDAPKNVYQKIQRVRAELVNMNLRKTGKNTYSNFTYYELGDFLPALNRLMDKYGVFTRFVIQSKNGNSPEKAVLEVFNADKPEEKVVFYSETAEVAIGKKANGTGGAEPIQNLGGKITYMRRYLLMNAFEIVESDRTDTQDQNNPADLSLDEESVKKIDAAKDLEELATVCRDIRSKKGPKYHKALTAIYTRRKGELENANS